MKRSYLLLVLFGLCAVGINAQTPPTTTAGQVCRVTEMRVKPNKGADFVRFRRQNTKPILDEQKKQGLIESYMYYTKPVLEGRDDSDLISVTCYKTYADAIDFNADRSAKFDAISLKHYGTADARTKANDSLIDLR